MVIKTFLEWLQLESKGIRLPNEVLEQVRSFIGRIYAVSKDVKQKPGEEVFDVVTIKYKDPYFQDRNREISVHVVNNEHENNNGSFRIGYGIQINVAHVEEKDLTIKWVERVLTHELIHSLDPKMSNFDIYKTVKNYSSSGDMDYYTHPFEFDAYTGQLVNSILSSVDRYKGTSNEPVLRKLLDDTLKFISNPDKSKSEKVYGVLGDSEYWKYYHIYFMHGSAQQKRKMQQRIYKAVMDAKEKLA